MADLEAFGIPEEEWSLLTNALAEPVEQLIAVESKDPEQLNEVERRLPELVGPRTLLRQVVDLNTLREPNNVFKTAELLVKPFAVEIPLLVIVIAIWSEQDDGETSKQLAAFWRGMNQLRELWHSLSAQVLFLLSPIAYKHLSLIADHLKRWISLKLRLWEGSTDLEVLARPGREEGVPIGYSVLNGVIDAGGLVARTTIRRKILAHQLEEAINRGESKSDQVRRYYLPLITESLVMGDRQMAIAWREKIGSLEELASEDRIALQQIDQRLEHFNRKHRYDVYLIYNFPNQPTISKICKALRNKGLTVWQNANQIPKGSSFQALQEVALREAASVAVLIGNKGDLGHWQINQLETALKLAANTKLPIIPVLLPDAPKKVTLPPSVANRGWVDFRQGITEAKIDQLVWGITGKKPSVSA